ncbi:TPA: hypothetical protein DF272_01560 [Candidatus Falkowbacteria bacterium]|nr:hypothetical protein [Candidatus Falkowbacteria bacterium]
MTEKIQLETKHDVLPPIKGESLTQLYQRLLDFQKQNGTDVFSLYRGVLFIARPDDSLESLQQRMGVIMMRHYHAGSLSKEWDVLVVDGWFGDIHNCIKKLIEQSTWDHRLIGSSFNGTGILVQPGDNAKDVYAAWKIIDKEEEKKRFEASEAVINQALHHPEIPEWMKQPLVEAADKAKKSGDEMDFINFVYASLEKATEMINYVVRLDRKRSILFGELKDYYALQNRQGHPDIEGAATWQKMAEMKGTKEEEKFLDEMIKKFKQYNLG